MINAAVVAAELVKRLESRRSALTVANMRPIQRELEAAEKKGVWSEIEALRDKLPPMHRYDNFRRVEMTLAEACKAERAELAGRIKALRGARTRARAVASEMIDADDGSIDKWGPALCVELAKGRYLFFGLASS